MGFLKNGLQAASRPAGDVNRALGLSPNNFFVKASALGNGTMSPSFGAMNQRFKAGDGLSARTLAGPSLGLIKEKGPATQEELERGAQEQVDAFANTATSAANQEILARKKRSALATGAQGGTGQLSSALAYGKQTLGG